MISIFGWRFWSATCTPQTALDAQLIENLKKHVYVLSDQIGDRSVFQYDNLLKTADYITEQFSQYSYTIESQEYIVMDKKVSNIIATKPGQKHPEKIVIVGAHYDTHFNPGADDNASGIAGLLELARLPANQNTDATIKFIAFVNEEPPFFKTDNMGSAVYVKSAKSKNEDIIAAVILEIIGYYTNQPLSQKYPPFFGLVYPNKGNFIATVGNFKSSSLVKKIVRTFKAHSTFPIESITTFGFVPGVDFSDHYNFWKAGYPAVMITDTAFYRYPYYHSDSDTFELLDYDSMTEIIKGFEKAMLELAK